MNKKLTVKNTFGKTVYCVLSETKPFKEQLMEVLSLHEGYGYTVEYDENHVSVKDVRTNETVGKFIILSLADTEEEVSLQWN